MDNNVIFYSNSYFDDIVGFLHADVHTWQNKFKPFSCSQCGKDLYEAKNAMNKTDFVERINSELKRIVHPRWPYQNDLFIQISVTNTVTKIAEADIDNLTKTVFDSIKGIVFKDDKQVMSVFSQKTVLDEIPMSSFLFGIKELQKGERAQPQDSLWSANESYTKELREYRERIERPSLFHFFSFSENNNHQIGKKRLNKLIKQYEVSKKID